LNRPRLVEAGVEPRTTHPPTNHRPSHASQSALKHLWPTFKCDALRYLGVLCAFAVSVCAQGRSTPCQPRPLRRSSVDQGTIKPPRRKGRRDNAKTDHHIDEPGHERIERCRTDVERASVPEPDVLETRRARSHHILASSNNRRSRVVAPISRSASVPSKPVGLPSWSSALQSPSRNHHRHHVSQSGPTHHWSTLKCDALRHLGDLCAFAVSLCAPVSIDS